jgi:hypothetical protein
MFRKIVGIILELVLVVVLTSYFFGLFASDSFLNFWFQIDSHINPFDIISSRMSSIFPRSEFTARKTPSSMAPITVKQWS